MPLETQAAGASKPIEQIDEATLLQKLQQQIDTATANHNEGALVNLYYMLGAYDEHARLRQDARQNYERAIAHSDGQLGYMEFTLRSYEQLEWLSLMAKDYAGAIKAAQDELALVNRNPTYLQHKLPVLIMMGTCHAQQGLDQQAKTDFDTAWQVADELQYPSEDSLNALLKNSRSLYLRMKLPGQAEAAEAHAMVFLFKPRAQQPRAVAPALPRTASAFDTPAHFADAGLNDCEPRYPDQALARKEEGTVHLRFVVNESGSLAAAEVIKSSGSDTLDRAALAALVKCRFVASTREQHPGQGSFAFDYQWKLPH